MTQLSEKQTELASSRFDPGLEILMQGHLLKNICEPYVIRNKKGPIRLTDRLSLDLPR